MKNNSSIILSDTPKILAYICMVVDHIGILFFPSTIFFRLIGRVSFPIFAYYISQGYLRTSSVKRYILRLLLLAIISQPIYYLSFSCNNLNTIFTLLIGLLFIYCFDNQLYWISASLFISSFFIKLDYGSFGILIIFFMYYFKGSKKSFLYILIADLIYCFAGRYNFFVFFNAISYVVLQIQIPEVRLNKYISYIFYPLHLSILLLIKYL